MNWDTEDVICAVATARGGALRGIVRVSGRETARVIAGVFAPHQREIAISALDRPTAVQGDICLSTLGRHLAATLLLWPTARSYTRQPAAELHTLGSPPLLEAVVAALLRHGARPARHGEFTLRAFLGGRLDLTQAEAVLGVIDADGDEPLHVALRQLAGGLGGALRDVREQLLDLCAQLEAGLDFADEDLTLLPPTELTNQLQRARATLRELLEQFHSRNVQRPAYRAALVGSPNVGKSSLFNALVGRAAALVSSQAGTTRDYLLAPLRIAAASVELIDTAGLNDTLGQVDSSGGPILHRAQQSGRREAGQSDLRLLCLDVSRPLNDWEREQLVSTEDRRIIVLTKCDLAAAEGVARYGELDAVRTSVVTGEGLDELQQRVAQALGITTSATAPSAPRGEPITESTAARCGANLVAADEALRRAVQLVEASAGDELVAAEVRVALEELGKSVGAVYTDDILDRVFSRFCIGK